MLSKSLTSWGLHEEESEEETTKQEERVGSAQTSLSTFTASKVTHKSLLVFATLRRLGTLLYNFQLCVKYRTCHARDKRNKCKIIQSCKRWTVPWHFPRTIQQNRRPCIISGPKSSWIKMGIFLFKRPQMPTLTREVKTISI
jgi:hypothetical protein